MFSPLMNLLPLTSWALDFGCYATAPDSNISVSALETHAGVILLLTPTFALSMQKRFPVFCCFLLFPLFGSFNYFFLLSIPSFLPE